MLSSILYVGKQILASVYRIEHKLDVLLRSQKIPPSPMNGSRDSISNKPVKYHMILLEDGSTVAIRTDVGQKGCCPEVDGKIGILTEEGVSYE